MPISPSTPIGVSLLTVIIPVFRAELTLDTLYHRLVAVLTPLVPAFELILVEDCGGDASWSIIQTLAQRDNRVRGVRLGRNYGQHNALLCGVRLARGDAIITLDDDLQNPPEEIPRLLEKLADADVVYGTPRQETHGLLRDLASQITKWVLQGAMGADTAGKISAFRAFRTQLRDAFANFCSPTVNLDVLLTWGTHRFTAVVVHQDPRTQGVSGYTMTKLMRHAINLMTGFSTLPLQLASLVGFIFAAFGFLVLLYVLGRYWLVGSSVPGFPFLASIIAIFSGAQLFALGIIGEYLARIHFRSMDRPPYTVQDQTPPAGRTCNI